MATHRETGTIEAHLYTDDSVQRLVTFYLANGYRVVERRDEAGELVAPSDPAHHLDDQPAETQPAETQPAEGDALSSAKFERGKPGAGWWTSNMSKLHTVVVVESDGERVDIAYEVDTSGQMLKEVEKAFWRRELQWAYRYAKAESDEPRDLRDEEERRAKHQTSDMRSIGLWGAMTVFIVIVTLGFFGVI
jgi:hypothetical protein